MSDTEIEAEIPYPLTQVTRDIEAALQRKSFHDRIAEKLKAARTCRSLVPTD